MNEELADASRRVILELEWLVTLADAASDADRRSRIDTVLGVNDQSVDPIAAWACRIAERLISDAYVELQPNRDHTSMLILEGRGSERMNVHLPLGRALTEYHRSWVQSNLRRCAGALV